MVELLWRLVLKINARAVFLFTVLLLCILLVVMFRRGARRTDDLKLAGHSVWPVAGDVLGQEGGEAAVAEEDIEDPFTSAFLMAWLDLEASRRREREAARAATVKAAAPPKAAVVPDTKPAPPPKIEPKWISVKYLGMIARTDGFSVAMVSEVDGGMVHTLKEGDAWLAYHVKSVTAARVTLDAGEGLEEEGLPVGVVSRVRKGDS